MNCAEFDEIVHELDRPARSPVDASLSEAALEHAESCSRCARLLTEVEALNFALHTMAQHDGQEQAPRRLEASLLQAFRQQVASQRPVSVGAPRTASRVRTYGLYAAVAGVAAAALLAVGLTRTWIATDVRHPSVTTVAGTPKVTAPAGPTVLTRRPDRSGDNLPLQQAAASEDATSFYALPYADDDVSLDGGVVIRVSVPRSALVAWGLPVSGMGSAGPIPADLVVGADGTPQAIRLVSETNE